MRIVSVTGQSASPPPEMPSAFMFLPSDYWVAIASGVTLAVGGALVGAVWRMVGKIGHFIGAVDRNTEAMEHISQKLEQLEIRIDRQETAVPNLEQYLNERLRNFDLRIEAILLEFGKKNAELSDDIADMIGYLSSDRREYPFRKSRRSTLVISKSTQEANLWDT
jgi:septal ring factor EnvC (AmiA/AmiB activator)